MITNRCVSVLDQGSEGADKHVRLLQAAKYLWPWLWGQGQILRNCNPAESSREPNLIMITLEPDLEHCTWSVI